MDTFIFVLEIIGTVAFASSGAMIAIEKKMDIFGVNILGATTAVGGGMMRDIILGITPAYCFRQAGLRTFCHIDVHAALCHHLHEPGDFKVQSQEQIL